MNTYVALYRQGVEMNCLPTCLLCQLHRCQYVSIVLTALFHCPQVAPFKSVLFNIFNECYFGNQMLASSIFLPLLAMSFQQCILAVFKLLLVLKDHSLEQADMWQWEQVQLELGSSQQ